MFDHYLDNNQEIIRKFLTNDFYLVNRNRNNLESFNKKWV